MERKPGPPSKSAKVIKSCAPFSFSLMKNLTLLSFNSSAGWRASDRHTHTHLDSFTFVCLANENLFFSPFLFAFDARQDPRLLTDIHDEAFLPLTHSISRSSRESSTLRAETCQRFPCIQLVILSFLKAQTKAILCVCRIAEGCFSKATVSVIDAVFVALRRFTSISASCRVHHVKCSLSGMLRMVR